VTLIISRPIGGNLVISSASIVTSGLVLNLDAGNPASYPGSGTTWTNLIGSGNAATLTNGPTYSSANSGSIVFDGTNDYAGGSFISAINLSFYTVDFWIKPSAFGNYNQNISFCAYSDTSPWNGFTFHTTSSGTLYVGTKLGDRMSNIGGAAAMTLNVWQNYTFVNNNGNCILYKNAVSYVTQACGVSGSNNTLYTFGVVPSGGASNGLINGNVASLKVYSGKALSAGEVTQNYNALRGRYGI
jgi:hypothetical protein